MLNSREGEVLARWPRLAQHAVSQDFLDWFSRRVSETRCAVERVPLTELRAWKFDQSTGNLAHESGRFFSIEGLHVRTTYGAVPEWSQPIINQPEIGILGMLTKEVDGELHCLVQAKMEPGNANTMQLSPTVQATRSNYTRAHRGSATRYLDYFVQLGNRRVLVDVLQSEQGSWFLRKRNRNIVVLVTDEVPLTDEHHWLPLSQLRRLLWVDDLVNMDTRTVLSCLPGTHLSGRPTTAAGNGMPAALATSVTGEAAYHDLAAVLSWFTAAKGRHELVAQRVPLRGLPGWHHDPYEIAHDQGRHFRIIGVTVRADSREVAEWDQPLLYPQGQGIVSFAVKVIDGVAHLLVHARFQPGLLDLMEMGPTVQCTPRNHQGTRPRFLDYILDAPAHRILYDAIMAEEGGRFFHSENRYVLVAAGDDFPLEVPDDFCWVTAHQLAVLLRHGYYLNIEARSLLACLHSLWSAP